MVDRLENPIGEVTVAVVGKYVELHDAYLSIKEALIHAGIAHQVRVHIDWIHSERLEQEPAASLLAGVDGILVCPGFGGRGIEGKLEAARYARENKIPYLGVCLGMQMMVIEFARNVLGLTGANSTEVDQQTPHPVISLLSEQMGIEDMGGTMRLGGYRCKLVAGHARGGGVRRRRDHRAPPPPLRVQQRLPRAADGGRPDRQRHVAGRHARRDHASCVDHPFMLGSQFHPEFKSRPDRPQPLFRDFVGAAKSQRAGVDAGMLGEPERVAAGGSGGSRSGL